ncbi:MAG: hypothetical protein V3T40_06670 [Nitrososphaerales archaeon]
MSMEKVLAEVKKLAEGLQKQGITVKVSSDNEAGVIRICGESSDMLKRAIFGLQEASELAYTTAEHHPYWGIIYHALEISKITLEKWDGELDDNELSELLWRIEEIKAVLDRLHQ